MNNALIDCLRGQIEKLQGRIDRQDDLISKMVIDRQESFRKMMADHQEAIADYKEIIAGYKKMLSDSQRIIDDLMEDKQ